MRVRFKTLLAGPEGVFSPGVVIDAGIEEAEALIAGGFSEKLGPAAIGFMGIASAAVVAGVAIFKAADIAAEEAEQITNLSLRAGIRAGIRAVA